MGRLKGVRQTGEVAKYRKAAAQNRKNYKKLEPFICKGCNRVWQPMREASQISDYLIGFPKYGCTIKLCTNCKEKESNNGTNEENIRVS